MEVPDGMANELIRRKIAMQLNEVECMEIDTSKYENAMLDRKPRKRG
jgi:hypothetical protein